MVDENYDGWTHRWANGILHQMLGRWTLPVNDEDQAVQSGHYCNSSESVATTDEVNPSIVFVLFCFVFVFTCDPLKSSLTRENTSVSGEQILNNPMVWERHNIPPMIKISNQNITERRTQATGALLIANMGEPVVILRMLTVLFSGTWTMV